MKTPTERSKCRDKRQRAAGFVKASTSGWVRQEDHVAAKAAMREALEKYVKRTEPKGSDQ